MANNNANKPYRVYRVVVNDFYGVEWSRVRYLDTKEEATEYVEYRKQHNPVNAKFFIVHKSKEEAFEQKMNEKFEEWFADYTGRQNKERKQISATDYNRGTPRYACRMNSHGYGFAGATRLA